MALSAHSYFSTLDLTSNTNVYDYSPYFYKKPLPGGDVVLWPLLNKRQDLYDTTCRWYEDAKLPIQFTTLSSGGGAQTASAADTDLVTTSGGAAAAFLRVGDVIRDTTSGKRELEQITAISTDTLTVTRCYGLTSADGNTESHAVSSVWEVVARLNSEGSTITAGEGANMTERTNYTSIIDQTVVMTRSQMRRRLQAGQGDPWNWEVVRALEKFERVMEKSVIWSKDVARAATPTTGSFAGIQDMIVGRAGSNYVTTSETFSYEVFDDAMKALWTNGYDEMTPFVLVVPAAGAQYAAYIHESAMQGAYITETTRGMRARNLMSTFGHTVPIVPSTSIQLDEFYILNLDLITVRFMDTMLAFDVPLGEAGTDAAKRRFISELSLEMHNADTAHYYHTGVIYTRPS